jgi:hypothetical protein
VTGRAPRLIRFVRAQVNVTENGCEATVEVEHVAGGTFTATARGPTDQQNQLRAVARPTGGRPGRAERHQSLPGALTGRPAARSPFRVWLLGRARA